MRQRVIALVEAGYGARSAGRLSVFLEVQPRGCSLLQNSGEVENRLFWASADFFIGRGYSLIETVRLDPFRTANEIRAASNFPGSSQTVISRLRNRCIRSRRAAQMEILGKHKLSAILPSLPIEWISIGEMYDGYLASERDEGDNAGEMSPRSSTDSYPAFARNGLRENPGKNLNQRLNDMKVIMPVKCPDPGPKVTQYLISQVLGRPAPWRRGLRHPLGLTLRNARWFGVLMEEEIFSRNFGQCMEPMPTSIGCIWELDR
ncbi:hypothetical protein ANN_12468 [Periplaneta americana]|uniref:Uncharacterized protein n=1 Tax=Periplaneta americana TaxID=6978 RepID=A0ABQ8TGL0_PERAM|nr:hypothetical protein ANN_12468 [Periplaneta americana]